VASVCIDGTLEMGGKLVQVGVPFHFDGTMRKSSPQC
jgi:hypothetical protein